MLVTRRNPFTGKENTKEIPVTERQMRAWIEGDLIQDAMPNLSADDREFIISGLTPEDWKELFPDE